MRTKMKIVKNWILAFVIAVLIGNSVSLIYERPTGWIDRENSSTPAIFNPGSVLVHNTEGHGVYQADKNGYFNKGTLVDSGYTIITGASHTAGKEVAYGYRYSDLLNLMLKSDSKYSEDDIVAYNVSMDAYFFPAIINGFSCIVSEFPNSDNIVIEVGKTNFDVESLETALPQKLYSESERGALIRYGRQAAHYDTVFRKRFGPSVRKKRKIFIPTWVYSCCVRHEENRSESCRIVFPHMDVSCMGYGCCNIIYGQIRQKSLIFFVYL